MGRHGPELLAVPVRPGLPGVSHHRLCGDLRRPGPEHRRGYRHQRSHLDLHGLYRASMLHAL